MSFYAAGGKVTVASLKVYPIRNTWRYEPTGGGTPEKVVMDKQKLELGIGSTERLYTSVLPRTATNKTIIWSSSNTAIAAVSAADSRSANVTGMAQGRAVITATTQSGSIVGSTVVYVGASFNTNLTGWASSNQAAWLPTADGIAGFFDRDSNYMSAETGTNFTYETDLKLDQASGAGSVIFRADSTGANGYYFNVDPDLRMLRLIYKLNGAFTDSQVLAAVPMMVQAGKTYHVKIVTNGTNIKVYFDGSSTPTIDVTDANFSSGYFGLNVFGGRAYYQNITKS